MVECAGNDRAQVISSCESLQIMANDAFSYHRYTSCGNASLFPL
ncbi:MAG: hypothetical protein UY31_C0011G0012 [Candidatus Wolfebacteria bacterium GW2011_GWE1_48_7]|nr:MAG: hypothetical protein UY31_C0011G0012 [Candidatus Wolfebacteria bacterium GW2011_GWE1_48_7]